MGSGRTDPQEPPSRHDMLANLAYASLDITSGLTPELVKSDQVLEAFRKVELNTYHYGYSTRLLSVLMAKQGPSYLHALTSSETSVLATNKYEPDKRFPYVFIFPAEGTFWSDNPFCILDTDWVSDEEREAAEIYRDYLLQKEQQELAVTIGLRPANPDVPLHCPICLDYYTDPRVSFETVPPLEGVSGETAEAIIDVFELTKKKSTTAIVLDTSGSMAGEKIRNAIEGTISFIDQLGVDDELIMFQFNDSVVEMQPLDRSDNVLESLKMRVSELEAGGGTVLYDAVCQTIESMIQAKETDERIGEKRLYGIVILSDGMDTQSEISGAVMFECLPSGEDVEGIKVFTIAYGLDADEALLKKIAERTNGKNFTADPENISEIYKKISSEQ
jgi:Ca-activated chloride channel family protein